MSGSFSRTAVNASSGAKSSISSLFAAVVLLIALYALGPGGMTSDRCQCCCACHRVSVSALFPGAVRQLVVLPSPTGSLPSPLAPSSLRLSRLSSPGTIVGVHPLRCFSCALVAVLKYLPKLVLAAVVLIAIVQLVELKNIVRFWRVQRRYDGAGVGSCAVDGSGLGGRRMGECVNL